MKEADLLSRYESKIPVGIARASKPIAWTDPPPPLAVQLEMVCPKAYSAEDPCGKTPHFWYCEICHNIFYYYNNFLYCECTRAKADTFEFRCTEPTHGAEFYTFEKTKLQEILSAIKPKKDINILVLGKVGAGKTTWLNAYANYLSYPTLAKAKQKVDEPIYLVPTQFMISSVEVKIGKETESEKMSRSDSATKHPRAIVFETRDARIRFIDTPGMAELDRIEEDNKNVKNILNFLANYPEIHAICVLIKPDEATISIELQYGVSHKKS